MINGIGGSGDFARNAYLSIFVCPSVAKRGKISTIVPMCTHVDHNEHTVQVIVTEYGFADLRGVAPRERAQRIIERCAHPAYRDYLSGYLCDSGVGHIRHDLSRCFELHRNLERYGAMLPDLELESVVNQQALVAGMSEEPCFHGADALRSTAEGARLAWQLAEAESDARLSKRAKHKPR
jgi:acetyl-CoA hydrolase